jgi:2-desacetyl-2-hydroxyethyl bacteriochlorophyllide A dehydrogenase
MKAAIIDAPQKMRVGEWDTPEPGPHEVLVRIRAAGICAGDVYIYLGKNPYANYPRIAGHELCGTIEKVGSSIAGIRKGMLVVVEPFIGCGKCYACRVGKSNCCANLGLIGTNLPGGYAEFVTAPVRNMHPVPQSLSPMVASFTEPLAIGVQACRRGDVKRGEYVLILGCGPIGMALIEVAKARGANVVATDVSEARLEFAKTLGATTLQADQDLLKSVLDQTNGEGAAVVIEATGNPKAMEQTVELVASGGRIVIVGLVKKGVNISIPALDITRKEMTLLGSRASVSCFPEALKLLASGKVQYPKVATQLKMWDAPAIFAKLVKDPTSMHKGVLVID